MHLHLHHYKYQKVINKVLPEFEAQVEEQAENLRKMFLAMAKDIRVVIVKLADRLHNLRTLSALPPDKQKKIARILNILDKKIAINKKVNENLAA